MFTGELPSAVGMHEAYPYFDRQVPTVIERMAESRHTSLFSTNMWLFQGLDRGVMTSDDFSGPDLPYPSASDPDAYFGSDDTSGGVQDVLEFAFSDGKPLRSLRNYVEYRRRTSARVAESSPEDSEYRHVTQINEAIRRVRDRTAEDHFVFVNYMDIHPPLNASTEALQKFASDFSPEELPVGIAPERHIENEEKSYDVEAMEHLYRAAIWDFDREFAPLVGELLADDAFVIVTSDHGIWNRNTAYSDSRLHVPLVVFAPDEDARTVPYTVNLRFLPRTIDEYVNGGESEFAGTSLLDVDEDQLSVTEIIHHPNDVYERTGRVDVTKTTDTEHEIQRDLVLIRGDVRVDYIAGAWRDEEGPETERARLRQRGEEILSQPVIMGEQELTYDEAVRRRLEDLGYM
jgi:arylsulfatase A-like enzyme